MTSSFSLARHGCVAASVVGAVLTASLALVGPAAQAAQPEKPAADKAAFAEKKGEPSREEIEQKLAAARKRLDSAAREVADLSMSLSENVMPDVWPFMGGQRAMLGINLGPRRDGDAGEGVTIASVSPGGPAAEAGLKAGDVIVDVNGTSLKRDESGSARSKLLKALDDVEPQDKVAVQYRRDGKTSKATLIARPMGNVLFTRSLPAPPGEIAGAFGRLPKFAFLRAEGVFGAAELVPMTPKLGQYFGTDTGLLVVRAPSDSRLKLEDGDVILDIDGRTPSSAAHALRILSSYQAGEKLKLNVLRARKRVTFDVTIPEGAADRFEDTDFFYEDHDDVVPPGAGLMPLPPGAPTVIARRPLPDDRV